MAITPEQLLEKAKSYDIKADLSQLEKACQYAIKMHGNQKRESGDPYYQHPIEVAYILAEMRLDIGSLITGLLHDTVEDTDATLEEIESLFGLDISRLVDGVTKLTKIEYQPDHIRQAENFRKLLLAMSEDIRVLLVKLADRVHNMRTIQYIKSPEKRLRIAHETMEIYAPLAERIGIQKIKNELQELAFAELHPEAHRSIISRLEYLREEGLFVVDRIVQHLSNTLNTLDINANVYGREKTPCSIWQKMERKNVSFEQLSDIIAFRILVSDISECYHSLGAVHSSYHMVPDSFKDFISTPKGNGYQSLHTVVMGPEQQRIEIQIRTTKMHEIAELGVAAHWSYKQGAQYIIDGKQYRWVRELLDILAQASSPEEFLENTKMEMYYDQVFAFTPKGLLIALPKGATPVDFAYAVHSDVGNSCAGAKINGRIVPLRTQLTNGDQVEIIRSKTQGGPSPAWEQFVITGKARAEVKRHVRNQQREQFVVLGKAILHKLIRKETGKDLQDKLLEPLLEIFRKKTVDDLYFAVGGTINRSDIAKALFPEKKQEEDPKQRFGFLKIKNKNKSGKIDPYDEESVVSIKGLIPGMAVHFAGCCHPLPGDRIVGIVHTGKGITIHTIDCDMLENYASTPERWIDVGWQRDNGNELYVGRLKAVLTHETGSLATLTATIAKDLGNITNLKIVNRSIDFFEILVDVEVKGLKHLNNIVTSLRSRSCIQSVERYRL
jgi:GTP diphosphokinase / guanosine-3',5'-bis(diphosphate) 3'-diphosphatase